jgi:hypothetical protein
MASRNVKPTTSELALACQAVLRTHPDFGSKRVGEAVEQGQLTWIVPHDSKQLRKTVSDAKAALGLHVPGGGGGGGGGCKGDGSGGGGSGGGGCKGDGKGGKIGGKGAVASSAAPGGGGGGGGGGGTGLNVALAMGGGPKGGTIPWTAVILDKDEDGDKIELGRGSFGTVYAGVFLHQLVAVKQFGAGAPLSAAALAAVQREAELQSRLAHDNVVRVYGLAVEDRPGARPKYALVLARLHESLSELLARAASGDCGPLPGALPVAWRLSALHDVAAGLAHLHAHRITHGDLKPPNIMLSSLRTGCVLQITDFGLAREGGTTLGSAAAAGGGRTAAMGAGGVGTVGYMAPELTAAPVRGAPPPRPGYRTDVFAWTVVAWQLLAASPSPYPGFNDEQARETVRSGGRPDLAALPRGLPASIPALLASGWAAAPSDRPRSGCELLEALREAAPPADLPPPLPPALAPGGGAAAVAAAAASAVAAGSGAAVGLGRAPEVADWRPGLVVAECPICGEENLAGVNLGCAAGHEVCMGCALRVIRDELTQEATMVRCPLCPRAPGAEAPVSEAAVLEVASWSRRLDLRSPPEVAGAAGTAGALRPLGPGELARFYRLESDRRERADAVARRAAEAAAPLPEGLFKRCPGRRPDGSLCGEGIQHPRGHACHHIKPGTGCPTCRTHFCFACLGPHPCRSGCRMFCTPSPHEPAAAACDCSDCIDCAPGRPCADCDNDGRCFVCQPDRRPRLAPGARPTISVNTAAAVPRPPAQPARVQPVPPPFSAQEEVRREQGEARARAAQEERRREQEERRREQEARARAAQEERRREQEASARAAQEERRREQEERRREQEERRREQEASARAAQEERRREQEARAQVLPRAVRSLLAAPLDLTGRLLLEQSLLVYFFA